MNDYPIPANYELVQLCELWHGGQTTAMYSVASTGSIHDDDTLSGLCSELRQCVRLADTQGMDIDGLTEQLAELSQLELTYER